MTIHSQTDKNIFTDQVRDMRRVGGGGGQMVTILFKLKVQNLSMQFSLLGPKNIKQERNILENSAKLLLKN